MNIANRGPLLKHAMTSLQLGGTNDGRASVRKSRVLAERKKRCRYRTTAVGQ